MTHLVTCVSCVKCVCRNQDVGSNTYLQPGREKHHRQTHKYTNTGGRYILMTYRTSADIQSMLKSNNQRKLIVGEEAIRCQVAGLLPSEAFKVKTPSASTAGACWWHIWFKHGARKHHRAHSCMCVTKKSEEEHRSRISTGLKTHRETFKNLHNNVRMSARRENRVPANLPTRSVKRWRRNLRPVRGSFSEITPRVSVPCLLVSSLFTGKWKCARRPVRSPAPRAHSARAATLPGPSGSAETHVTSGSVFEAGRRSRLSSVS